MDERAIRVTCFTDALAAGGAQRQLSLLAVLLKRMGYDVEVLIYRRVQFFDSMLESAGIPVRRLPRLDRLRRAIAVRRAIRDRDPDAVIAFLKGPAAYAELACLPRRRFGLIVSEFTVPDNVVTVRHLVRLAGHRIADAIVTETDNVRRQLVRVAPWLADKFKIILNGVDLDHFRPATDSPAATGQTRVLVVGRYKSQKNPRGMLAAMEWLRRMRPDAEIVLDWYGRTFFANGAPTALSREFLELKHAVLERGLASTFRLHGVAQDIASLYHGASLVCLPSHYEGCPNVLCEALASGVPVVASDVGANGALVIEGETGFLCNPAEPRTIAEAILRFHGMPESKRREMSRRARARAETLLDPHRFAASYADLVNHVASRRSSPRGPGIQAT